MVESFSLAAQPAMIRLLTRQHRFEKPDIESASQFFEPDLAFFQSLSRQNAEGFQPLQNANQGIDVLIPEIKLAADVGSQGSALPVVHFALACTLVSKVLRAAVLRLACVRRNPGGERRTNALGGRALARRVVGLASDLVSPQACLWFFGLFMAGIEQPAQEGCEPETIGAWRVAPAMGNG
jgi:hypothetical protein